MRYAELFAGAGGLSLGLDRAGWDAAWHAEIDVDARAVLAHRWPGVPLYGDVSTLDGRALVEAHGPLDLLSGGSPCQDLSVAGKRAGLAGARSGLFHHQVRLWQETGATYILWENVLGALSSNRGADFASVLSAIVGAPVPVPGDGWASAGVAAGPSGVAAWRCLDAQWFGVPQRRRRVFIVGARAGGADPAQVLLECDGVRGDPAPGRTPGQGLAAGAAAGAGAAGGIGEPDSRADAGAGRAGGRDGGGTAGAVGFRVEATDKASEELQPALVARAGHSDGNGCVVALANWQGAAESSTDGTMPTLTKMGAKEASVLPPAGPAVVLALDAEGNASVDVANTLGTHHSAHRQASVLPLAAVPDAAGTLEARTRAGGFPGTDGACAGHVVAQPAEPFAFKASHFTRGKDGAPSDVVPPLTADADKGDQDPVVVQPAAQPVARHIAFTTQDSGQDATVDMAPTLRAGTHRDGNQNGGVMPAVVEFFDQQRDSVYGTGGLASTLSARDYKEPTDIIVAHPLEPAIMSSGQANANTLQDGTAPSLTCLHEAPIVAVPTGREWPAEIAPTLNAHFGDKQGLEDQHAMNGAGLFVPSLAGVPRRLTPRECERLMGWGDDWTLVPRTRTAAERREGVKLLGDGARYRLCGNGVAAPVAHWIGWRLAAVHGALGR